MINEYVVGMGKGVVEDDEPQDGGAPAPDMGGAPAGDPNAMGGAPDMGGAPEGDTNAMGGAPDMGGAPEGDPNAMGGAPDGGSVPPQGLNPEDGATAPDMGDMGGQAPMDDNTLQPDDEVIDVSELTDGQNEIQHEIEKINNKYDKVVKALGAFEELIRASNDKIDDLKGEYERRNPTQVEKLSMQTAKSYPFNVTPEEFWKEKEATTNYRTEDDDNGKEQGQYVITQNDVDGDVNWKGIADSLDSNSLIYNQSLKNLLGL